MRGHERGTVGGILEIAYTFSSPSTTTVNQKKVEGDCGSIAYCVLHCDQSIKWPR